jgi:hypothetical protein
MCPACGNRRVVVVFEPPSNAQMGRGNAEALNGFDHLLRRARVRKDIAAP